MAWIHELYAPRESDSFIHESRGKLSSLLISISSTLNMWSLTSPTPLQSQRISVTMTWSHAFWCYSLRTTKKTAEQRLPTSTVEWRRKRTLSLLPPQEMAMWRYGWGLILSARKPFTSAPVGSQLSNTWSTLRDSWLPQQIECKS